MNGGKRDVIGRHVHRGAGRGQAEEPVVAKGTEGARISPRLTQVKSLGLLARRSKDTTVLPNPSYCDESKKKKNP